MILEKNHYKAVMLDLIAMLISEIKFCKNLDNHWEMSPLKYVSMFCYTASTVPCIPDQMEIELYTCYVSSIVCHIFFVFTTR